MKKFLMIIAITVITAFAINYLYSLKLGAIPFLLIAIFFFFLAFRQFSKEEKNKPKTNGNDEKSEY